MQRRTLNPLLPSGAAEARRNGELPRSAGQNQCAEVLAALRGMTCRRPVGPQGVDCRCGRRGHPTAVQGGLRTFPKGPPPGRLGSPDPESSRHTAPYDSARRSFLRQSGFAQPNRPDCWSSCSPTPDYNAHPFRLPRNGRRRQALLEPETRAARHDAGAVVNPTPRSCHRPNRF
jgi:hypothetical protein